MAAIVAGTVGVGQPWFSSARLQGAILQISRKCGRSGFGLWLTLAGRPALRAISAVQSDRVRGRKPSFAYTTIPWQQLVESWMFIVQRHRTGAAPTRICCREIERWCPPDVSMPPFVLEA